MSKITPEIRVESLRRRLSSSKEALDKDLRIISFNSERVLVQLFGHPYLYLLPTSAADLTPGNVESRIANWPSLNGLEIEGYIILASDAKLSSTVKKNKGASLTPGVAVVGLWGSKNELVVAGPSDYLLRLVQFAGVDTRGIDVPSKNDKGARAQTSAQPSAPLVPAVLTAPHQLRVGSRIDVYKLEKRLGRGASAEVWQATVMDQIPGISLAKGDSVALKVYGTSLLDGFQPIRIHREFSVAASISHPHIARVYDLVISPSRPSYMFMAMEFIAGPTLKQHISRVGKLSMLGAAGVGRQLFSALVELHSHNALHRDVKAANIMITDVASVVPTIKLLDLGIVAVTSDERLTSGSVFLGSKHSASLEQLTGGELDERLDIYGVGSVLFHCLQGVPMYHMAGPEGAIVQRMMLNPERLAPRSDMTESGNDLVEFVNSCVSVVASQRPSSAAECLDRISKIEQGLL